MKINLTEPIYPQLKNLSPIKYKEVTETILVKENDVYDYNTIQLYQSKFINFLTKSSLKMCYVFWISVLSYFYKIYMAHTYHIITKYWLVYMWYISMDLVFSLFS